LASKDEIVLDHLTGYAGSSPVRVGNAAYDQRQFDIFGAIVDCVFEHTRSPRLPERAILAHCGPSRRDGAWFVREPDRSIWEMRGELKHYTFSKVMCWLAGRPGARLAMLRGERARAQQWHEAAAEIHVDVLKNGLDAKGRFTQSYGSDELDASLLLFADLWISRSAG